MSNSPYSPNLSLNDFFVLFSEDHENIEVHTSHFTDFHMILTAPEIIQQHRYLTQQLRKEEASPSRANGRNSCEKLLVNQRNKKESKMGDSRQGLDI
ncbi:hypothetical protein Trydic_g21712 [Trypoxylus dichotomus]